MFIASKLLGFLTHPVAWALALLLFALWSLSAQRTLGRGRFFAWLALIVLVLQGWQTPPTALLRRLELQYPAIAPGTDLSQYSGVVVLGGALSAGHLWTEHGQMALNEGAERMVVPLILLAQHPQLKLLFTGGEGNLVSTGLSEAQRAKLFFDSMGVNPKRVLYEGQSRTTFENALLSAKLPGVDKTKPWLLLTSAYHMPRSVASFRTAGWNVTPYPVDYRTGAQTDWLSYSFMDGPETWFLVLHETLGLLAYKLAGRA